MSRNFGDAADNIVVSKGASVDNFSEFTFCAWVYPRSGGYSTEFGRFFVKGGRSFSISGPLDAGQYGLALNISRAITNLSSNIVHALNVDEWSFVACGFSSIGDSAFMKSWDKDLNLIIDTSPGFPNLGSGVIDDDDYSDIGIGCIPSASTRTFDGLIGKALYFDQYIEDNNLLLALGMGQLYPDFAPKLSLDLEGIDSPEPDYSGNENDGILTGTDRANNPPLPPEFYFENVGNTAPKASVPTVSGWIEVAPELSPSSIIEDLLSFDGDIYGGSGDDGRLLKWNGANLWIEAAPSEGGSLQLKSLLEFNSEIYVGEGPLGRLLKWNGSNALIEIAGQLNGQTLINKLIELNGKIYGCTSPGGRLFESDGAGPWVEVAGELNSQTEIKSMIVYKGEIYAGTSPGGRLFKWNNVDSWIQVAGQFGSETSIESLAVYEGDLFGGSNVNAKLLKFDNVSAWVEVADGSAIAESICSLIAFGGALYAGACGSSPEGGELLRWDNVSDWEEIHGTFATVGNIKSLLNYKNRIYGAGE